MLSGARDMALAVEIQLPVNALTQNQSSLTHLIEHAAAGDTAAFDQIMIHSQQRVMAMTWRMLGNEADARDASQEVFLRVYKYLPFQAGSGFLRLAVHDHG
jgi:sigma-70-like protein